MGKNWKQLVGVGTLLGLAWVLIMFNVVRALQSDASLSSRIVGVSIPLALTFALVVGTLGIVFYDLTSHAVRVSAWTILGMVTVIVAIILNIVAFDIVQPDYRLALYMVVNAAAGGGTFGLMIGLYDAHQQHLRDGLQAQRDRVRMFSQRLTVINRVLRHDIRNQSQIIRTHTERLQDEYTTADESVRKIRQANQRLTTLSEEARDLQKLLEGKEIENESIELVETIQSVGADVEQAYPELVVEYELPDEQVVHVSPLIGQAIKHLLFNAVEHNDSAQPRVTVAMSVDPAAESPVQLTVSDNGPGIPESERVYDGSESPLNHSSGFGLWFVNWVITDAGGEVDIDVPTDGDAGTVITASLPTPPDVDAGSLRTRLLGNLVKQT